MKTPPSIITHPQLNPTMNKNKTNFEVTYRLPGHVDFSAPECRSAIEAIDEDEAENIVIARYTDNMGREPRIIAVYIMEGKS